MSPKGDLQPQGARPHSPVRASPTVPSALSQAASCPCSQPLPELTSPSPQTCQLSALSTCPTCEHSALLPRKVRLGVLGLVQVLRHPLPSVPNQKLLFLGSNSLPGLWAAAQCQGAQSWGSPGLWRDRLLLPAAGQMEPQWWGLLPTRCAQGISAFKAAFVPGACSRKNCLAAPGQENVRPLASTGSAPQPVVGPRSETPTGCHLPPSSWMARRQDCPPGEGWGRWWPLGTGREAGRGVWFSPVLTLRALGNARGTLDSLCPRLQEGGLGCGLPSPMERHTAPCVMRVTLNAPGCSLLQGIVRASGQCQHKDMRIWPVHAKHLPPHPKYPRHPPTVCITPRPESSLTAPGPAWDNSHPELKCAGHIGPLS